MTSPTVAQSMIRVHAMVQQKEHSAPVEAALASSTESSRQKTKQSVQRGKLNSNSVALNKLALVQMTTTEEYEELADRCRDALLHGGDSGDGDQILSRPRSRFDSTFLQRTKKGCQRKLKTGTDFNLQLNHWPREEDRSRYFSSETEPDFRLNAKIVDQRRAGTLKRKTNDSTKSPNPAQTRYKLFDQGEGQKAESQSSAVKDLTPKSVFPLISSQYQLKDQPG